jgi:hypothetical protein
MPFRIGKMTRRKFLKEFTRKTALLTLIPPLNLLETPGFLHVTNFLSDHEKQTMLALADTCIPGLQNDPDRQPGAVEAQAWRVYHDPAYNIKPYIPFFVKDLDVSSMIRYGKEFANLSFAQRTELLIRKADTGNDLSIVYLVAMAGAMLAFYGGIVNNTGFAYIGYPGPSPGYDDYSYGIPMANLHPDTLPDGNLP